MPGPDDFEYDDFEPDFEEEPQSGGGYLTDLFNWGNKSFAPVFSGTIGRAGDWLLGASEAPKTSPIPDWMRAPAAYGGAFLKSFGDVADQSFTTPLGAGLTATTLGASSYIKAANAARQAGNLVEATRLYNIASKLETPGRVAAAGMIGHGGYNALTGDTTSEQLGGVAEGVLGGLGLRSMIRNPLKTDVLPAQPKNRPLLPENAGPSSHGNVTRFIGGEAGIAENRPYDFDMGPRNILRPEILDDVPEGSANEIFPTVLDSETTGLTKIPPSLAARTGLNFGKPALQFDKPFPNGLFGKSVTDDFTPDNSVSTDVPEGPQFSKVIEFDPLETKLKKVENELDPEIIKDNYNNAQQELEWAKIHGTPDDIEEAGMFRDAAYGRLKQLQGKGLFDEPSFARTETGKAKIGVDVKHAAGELTTGYSRPLPEIMVREGAQNAFDAVKHLGPAGEVKFGLFEAKGDKPTRLMISDNGKGMSPEELYTVYTDLHSSGKANDPNATGGKGVGKATYMLGGGHFEVKTVKLIDGKKIESTFSGTPEQLMEGFDIKSKEVPASSPTGTKFTTSLKEGQEHYQMVGSLQNIMKYSRGLQTKVKKQINDRYSIHDTLEYEEPFGGANDKVLLTNEPVDTHSNMDLFIPESAEIKGERSNLKISVLTNGMHQFDYWMYLGEPAPGVPSNLVVDVKPKVEEGTPDYPFPVQRESFKEGVKEEVERIIKNKIISNLSNNRRIDLKKLWDSMKPADRIGNSSVYRESVIFDSGDRLTPDERRLFEASSAIQNLRIATDVMIHRILENSKEVAWMDRVVRTGVILNSDLYGVHIPNPMAAKGPKAESGIFINYFEHAAKNPNPKDAAADAVITGLHEVAHVEPNDKTPRDFPPMSMRDLEDPRVGKYLQSYIKHVIESTGNDVSHQLSFVKRLGAIYAKTGTNNFLDLEDFITGIFTGGNPTGGYSPEFQKLLQIYKESRGRDPVTEDILSGTGVKQANKRPGGKGNIPGNNPTNGDGITGKPDKAGSIVEGVTRPDRTKKSRNQPGKGITAAQKLVQALGESIALREEQEAIYTTERGARAKSAKRIRTGGEEGFYKQLSKMRGPMEHVQGPNIRQQLQQTDIDDLFDTITNSQLDFWKQLSAKRGLAKLLGEYEGHVPQAGELKLLGSVFGGDIVEQINQLFGGLGIPPGVNFKEVVAETANTMKSMMASIDAGFLLRQGLPLAGRREFYQSFRDALLAVKSEKGFEAVQQAIQERPKFAMGEAAGLHFTDVNSASTREEAYMSNWAEKFPGLGPVIKRTSRMHTAFLNSLRAKVFDNMIDDAIKLGAITSDDLGILEDVDVSQKVKNESLNNVLKVAGDVAKFANVSTGRGSLGILEKNAVELNNLLFSPRLLSSRLTMLNPNYYVKLHPMVRKEALKALFTFAGATTMFVELLKQNGATVSNDPNSADFRKIRVGNTRIDPYGGFQQEIVAASRTIKAIREGEDATTIGMNFLENKLSPFASLVNELAKGKRSFPPTGVGGTVTDNKPGAHIINRFTPMIMGDIVDLANEDPNLIPLAGLGSVGMGLQTYQDTSRGRGFTGFRGFGSSR